MLVLDASIVANLVADDGEDGTRARDLARVEPVVLPDLADVEALAVLRKRWIAGDLDDRRFASAVTDLADLPLPRVPARPLLERMGELRRNLTAYDATYVALAEVLDAELVTADARLSRAPGVLCPIRVLA
ncbi:MAG: type II toxin-antitoxin system VapC family toxin [Iamia sp.]